MEEALYKVTPADAAGWFDHCDYQVEVQYLWTPLLRLTKRAQRAPHDLQSKKAADQCSFPFRGRNLRRRDGGDGFASRSRRASCHHPTSCQVP